MTFEIQSLVGVTASFEVLVIVGCFSETSILSFTQDVIRDYSASFLTGLSPPFLTSFDNNFFVMILPIPIPGDITTDTITLDLKEGVYFRGRNPPSTDYYNCPATSIQLFEDSSCITPLVSADISFAINPTVKDFDGIPRAVLNVNRANRLMEQYVYL